ncbi:diguanylate cyclase [Neorhodopirellula pilleata]|uniref:diguanylate cyclase n=1 Tax=Neorhodopirellula pilleata TaxID=2714738 RepID=A0A5C6AQW3_9BACT|nr:diguanylate cyclase [Neorhodopirellula pilleata]TWU01372.1 Response regulator PleD [Neorhodopirellula pilleata]
MKISSLARINFSIIMLCIAAILLAHLAGLIPDERVYQVANRAKLCEALSANISACVGDYDLQKAGKQFELFATQNPDLISVGLRRHNGDLVVAVGSHAETWNDLAVGHQDGIYVVQIENTKTKWGQIEIQFSPIYAGANQYVSPSLAKLLSFVAMLVGLACWLHLRRILRYLDPNKSVPPRVREVLNSFAEGVIVIDTEDRIVLANQSFAKYVGKTQEELLGSGLYDLAWRISEAPNCSTTEIPAGTVHGTQMQLADANGQIRSIFSVNSSPVLDDEGKYKGVMMAFTDVTPLERNRSALLSTLEELSVSKKEITKQNEELRYLATRDPLTSCINRRTFFELFEEHWSEATNSNIPLCGMMVDIDFFKSINDTYGHSMGDEVLRQTGALLNKMTRKNDVVCRYGGEEFAILMPGLDIADAEAAAESIRIRMSEMQFPDFTITASLGISAFSLGAAAPQDMLDQADKCLYVAKRNGRNQVVRFDTVPADLIVDESKISRTKPAEEASVAPSIPYSAVTALFSALTFRDHETAMHSNRVSTYASLLAQRVLSPKDVYVVETAALLHDIGKVGVPDAILLKPEALNAEEWEFMEKHDRIGVEIIRHSFKNQGLTDIVKYHHYRYGGVQCSEKQKFWGEDIPIGSRILTIVDSFDAMVSDRPYRKGMGVTSAVAELRRCSGSQFDPVLTEYFIEIVESGALQVELNSGVSSDGDVLLAIGEQIERLVEAADDGDGQSFVALAERLRQTADRFQIGIVSEAASNAIAVTNEDAQVETLVKQSFELLAACRIMRAGISPANLTSTEVDSNSAQVQKP